jgi:hypothetical protein
MGLYEDAAAAVKTVIDAHVARDTEAAAAADRVLEQALRDVDTARLDAEAAKQRADDLQRQLTECQNSTPPPPPPPPPKRVTLVGAEVQGNGDPSPMEKAAGVPLGVHPTYWNLDQIDRAVAQVKTDHAAGRVPWLSMKVGVPWGQAASGAVDAKVRDYAAKLKALGGEVWNVWHAEPQGDSDGTAAEFCAMHDRLNPLMPGNVQPWVVLIAYNTFGSNNPAYALPKWWPQSARGLGMNFYNPFGTLPKGATRRVTTWRELSVYADLIAQAAEDRDVDWAIRETGLTNEGAADPRGAGWMARNYHAASQNLIRKARGWNYFNSDLNSIGSWPLGPVTSLKGREFAAVMQEAHGS